MNHSIQQIIQRIKNIHFSFHLSDKEQIFFIKRMSYLLKADVSLVESVAIIREQTHSGRYRNILDKIVHDISNGQFLSSSLSNQPGMFGDFALHIIHIGESSGTLVENLEYLSIDLKKKQSLKRKVVGAFVYPAVVMCATLGITSFLIIYLFPKITPVFKSLHMHLPLSTRIVMGLSDVAKQWGVWIFIALLAVIITGIIVFKKSQAVRFQCDRFILRIPIIGTVVRDYNITSFTRTLGLLLRSNVTLGESLAIAVRTSGNGVYKKEFQNLEEQINRGEKISTHLLSERRLFPDMMSHIISVGERSGNLPHSFVYLADLHEHEIDEFTKNIGNIIEPVLMICMGLMVGFIAISIITPIYSITQNLHS